MKKKLINIEELDFKKLEKKAKNSDRSVSAEIRVAIKKHVQK